MGRLVKRFGGVVPGAVLDARVQAAHVLARAQEQAQQLLADAEQQAEALRAEARRRGEEEGRTVAEGAFTELLLAARGDAERVRRAAVPGARALAARMAEKIVGRTVDLEPEALVHIATEALAAARMRAGLVSLRLHPQDLSTLEAARPQLMARLAAAVELRLIADPTVDRAGCVVETPVGRLDARLSTQLAVLERAVFRDFADQGDAPPIPTSKQQVPGG